MFARYIVFILCLLSVSAHAGSRAICDQLLSSSSLTSVSDAPITQLSASAKAFVNLIQLYIDKSGGPLDEAMSNAISSANEFINPFASRKDSLSVLFLKGAESMRGKINAEDWSAIKRALVINEEKNKVAHTDRVKKEKAVATVFKPQLISDDIFEGQTQLPPVWLTVKGRAYVAAVSSEHVLYVYELVKGQLKLIDTYTGRGVTHFSAPAWQVVNDKIYLAVGDFDSNVNLIEIVKGQLSFRNKIQSRGSLTTSVVWQAINGRYFLAVAGHQYINSFELVGGKLKNHVYEEFTTRVDLGVSWYVWKDRLYLAAITNSALHVFELTDGEFVLRGWSAEPPINDFSSAPAWQEVNGRLFVVASGIMNSLYTFEFVEGQMGMTSSAFVISSTQTSNQFTEPVWQKVGGRLFVFTGSTRQGGLYLLEFIDGQLVKLDVKGFQSFLVDSFSVQVIKGRLFVVTANIDSNLQFYEVVHDKFQEQGVVRAESGVQHISKWQKIGEQYYVVFSSSNEEKIKLVSIFNDLKKQGGRK